MSGPDGIVFSALGGGGSIGGSAYLVRVQDTVVLVDFGIDPNQAPTRTFKQLLDRAEASGIVSSISDVSAVVLTHAHTDHAGLLPALFRQFRGKRVPPFYTTAATKSLLPLVYENVLKFSETAPFEKADVDELMHHIDIPQESQLIDWLNPDLGLVRLHPTSHLLGAAMAELEIGERVVLFTGDLKTHSTPTLAAAQLPKVCPNLLIVDGTYTAADSSRQPKGWIQSRKKLFDLLDKVVRQNGVLLLPSFALGRSQDILALVLEHAESRSDANYFVYLDGQSSLVTQEIYPRFKGQLHADYWHLYERNRWRIRGVDHAKDLESLIDAEIRGFPAVVIASSGMLLPESASRRWAEALMANPANVVAFTGYVTEDISEEIFDRGVLGNRIWACPPNRLGFSSHASLDETLELVSELDPKVTALVHCGSGDQHSRHSFLDQLRSSGNRVFVGRENRVFTITSDGARFHEC